MSFDWGQVISTVCISWLCCLQPMGLLLLGITIGKYGGLLSALGYFVRAIQSQFVKQE
jgi:hypothetical protein